MEKNRNYCYSCKHMSSEPYDDKDSLYIHCMISRDENIDKNISTMFDYPILYGKVNKDFVVPKRCPWKLEYLLLESEN